jgi:hypothetical protein
MAVWAVAWRVWVLLLWFAKEAEMYFSCEDTRLKGGGTGIRRLMERFWKDWLCSDRVVALQWALNVRGRNGYCRRWRVGTVRWNGM